MKRRSILSAIASAFGFGVTASAASPVPPPIQRHCPWEFRHEPPIAARVMVLEDQDVSFTLDVAVPDGVESVEVIVEGIRKERWIVARVSSSGPFSIELPAGAGECVSDWRFYVLTADGRETPITRYINGAPTSRGSFPESVSRG